MIYRPDGTPAWATRPWLPLGPAAQGNDMEAGEVLAPDQSINSTNGLHRFVYQSDGNLVLYYGTTLTWCSGTARQPVGVCIMQGDGNLVIYAPGGQPVWSSDTGQVPGSRLVVQDDGDVVIHRPDGTRARATNTRLPLGPAAQGDDMQPGEVLNPDQSITSANGLYRFVYHSDGNLRLYYGSTPLWYSGTARQPVGVCIMQGDGNLVVYAPGGQPIWSSDTGQGPGSRLVVQDDGDVVIYRPDGTRAWTTNTWLPMGPVAQGDSMQPGEVLNTDQSIASANGHYRFVYQGDGDLVLYNGSIPMWTSYTAGHVGVCVMQADGNLVIYARGGVMVWYSNTWYAPGSRLVVQDDGNVVIYRPDGTEVWATNTWLPLGPPAEGDDMQPGEILDANQSITSANGCYRLTYQGDGDLVLYDHCTSLGPFASHADRGTRLWASNTAGKSVGVCTMEDDGNLVIYAPGGHRVWSSKAWYPKGNRLVVQDDGQVVIYRPDGTPVWAVS